MQETPLGPHSGLDGTIVQMMAYAPLVGRDKGRHASTQPSLSFKPPFTVWVGVFDTVRGERADMRGGREQWLAVDVEQPFRICPASSAGILLTTVAFVWIFANTISGER